MRHGTVVPVMLSKLTIDNWITTPRNFRGYSFVRLIRVRRNGPALSEPVNALLWTGDERCPPVSPRGCITVKSTCAIGMPFSCSAYPVSGRFWLVLV